MRNELKYYAEEVKIQLSCNDKHNILTGLGDIPLIDNEGYEFELDITISQTELGKTVNISESS